MSAALLEVWTIVALLISEGSEKRNLTLAVEPGYLPAGPQRLGGRCWQWLI